MSTFRRRLLMAMPSGGGGGDEIPFGIGICTWEEGVRQYYTLPEWNALSVKPSVIVGVYLRDDDVAFIIGEVSPAKNEYSTPSNVFVSGVGLSSGTVDDAQKYYNGYADTHTLYNAIGTSLTSAPLITDALSHIFPDGNVAFVPSSGEEYKIYRKKSEIETILTAIGKTTIFGNHLMSSTQFSEDAGDRTWSLYAAGYIGVIYKQQPQYSLYLTGTHQTEAQLYAWTYDQMYQSRANLVPIEGGVVSGLIPIQTDTNYTIQSASALDDAPVRFVVANSTGAEIDWFGLTNETSISSNGMKRGTGRVGAWVSDAKYIRIQARVHEDVPLMKVMQGDNVLFDGSKYLI